MMITYFFFRGGSLENLRQFHLYCFLANNEKLDQRSHLVDGGKVPPVTRLQNLVPIQSAEHWVFSFLSIPKKNSSKQNNFWTQLGQGGVVMPRAWMATGGCLQLLTLPGSCCLGDAWTAGELAAGAHPAASESQQRVSTRSRYVKKILLI